jgi:hypothetical protein
MAGIHIGVGRDAQHDARIGIFGASRTPLSVVAETIRFVTAHGQFLLA